MNEWSPLLDEARKKPPRVVRCIKRVMLSKAAGSKIRQDAVTEKKGGESALCVQTWTESGMEELRGQSKNGRGVKSALRMREMDWESGYGGASLVEWVGFVGLIECLQYPFSTLSCGVERFVPSPVLGCTPPHGVV